MRKNNVLLAAAITATLIGSMSASYAEVANYPPCSTVVAASIPCNALFTGNTDIIGASIAGIVPIPQLSQGVVYGTHLFGGSLGDNVQLPSGTDNYAVVLLTIEGTPSKRLQIRATLDGAQFVVGNGVTPNEAAPPFLRFKGTGTNPLTGPQSDLNASCTSSKTQCQWQFGDDTTTKLTNKDEFYIIYKLTKAKAKLETAGGQVTMKVDLGVVGNSEIMGTKTITVASSQEPFKVFFEETGNPYIKIAVATESKGFVTQKPTASLPDEELPSASDAVFGYMSIVKEEGVKIDDGYTDWTLGETSVPTSLVDDTIKTTLTIDEEGQFAASQTGSNGSVYLWTNNMTDQIKAESVQETTAVWELNDSELKTLVGECALRAKTTKCIPIVIKADGTNIINVPSEGGPKAVFNLSYKKPESKDEILFPGADDPEQRLSRYRQDGISCWVYNVPSSNAIDQLNLRIINDSTIVPPGDDCVKGTLYDMTGIQVGTAALGCPGPNATLYLTSDDIIDKMGPLTSGRGTMLITSTLAKMEVLAMLRLKSPPCFNNVPGGCSVPNTNPLTNLSTGAHGVSCFN
ncbi:MAG: hypothetical protein HC877_08945 [Thioploca sp.]|nr:hypothetical protein [Thioploca sp.]